MTQPFISCIAVKGTPGCIDCFDAQDYPGPKELVMCAEFAEGVSRARGDWLVPWHPDHTYLWNHISTFAKAVTPETNWLRMSQQYAMKDARIVGISDPGFAAFAYSRAAWDKCKDNSNLSGCISEAETGVTITLPNDSITITDSEALYSPLYPAVIDSFLESFNRYMSRKSDKIALVTLGHCGDLFNVLPIARHIAMHHRPPIFVTSQLYGKVLEGVSYVKPVYLDIPDKEINTAIAEAQKLADTVIALQVHGSGFHVERLAESYNIDAWRMGGLVNEFHDVQNYPLVLDRRSEQRELWVYENAVSGMDHQKPLMAVNVTGGWCSPYQQGKLLLEKLRIRFAQEFNIVDMQRINGDFIFDMLGILDRAAVLISTDTYTLHLATAAPKLPVIAVVNDNPQPFGRRWLQTTCRIPPIFQTVYSAGLNDWTGIEKAVEGVKL